MQKAGRSGPEIPQARRRLLGFLLLLSFLLPVFSAQAQDWLEADIAAAQLMEQGAWRDARKEADRAVQLSARSEPFDSTQHANLVFQLADIQNELGNLTGIRRALNAGIRVIAKRSGRFDPEIIILYERLGIILQGAGEFADGRRAFRRAALKTEEIYGETDLRTITAQYGLIDWESRFRGSGFHRARQKLKKLTDLLAAGEQSSIGKIYEYFWQGRIHLYFGKTEEAKVFLLKAAEEAKKYPAAEYLLSDIYRELANFYDARSAPAKRQFYIEAAARLFDTALDAAVIQSAPRYSRGARTRAVRAWADVTIEVDETGKVSDVKILRSNGNDILEADIAAAIQNWIFPPALAGSDLAPHTISGKRFYFYAPNRASRFGR